MLHIEEAAHPNTKQKTESSSDFLESAIYNILYFHGKFFLYLSQFYLLDSPSTLHNALLKSVVCEMVFWNKWNRPGSAGEADIALSGWQAGSENVTRAIILRKKRVK